MTSDALLFAPGDNSLETFLVLGTAFVAIFAMVYFLATVLDSPSRKEVFITGAIMTVAMAGAAITFSVSLSAMDERKEAEDIVKQNRVAFFEDRGVRVPDSQWSSLDFPREEPTGDERFGIAQAEYEGKVVSVLLAWEDGELKLYSTDGEELRPVR